MGEPSVFPPVSSPEMPCAQQNPMPHWMMEGESPLRAWGVTQPITVQPQRAQRMVWVGKNLTALPCTDGSEKHLHGLKQLSQHSMGSMTPLWMGFNLSCSLGFL